MSFFSFVSQEDSGKKTQTDNRTACWEVKQQECLFKPDALVLLLTKTIKNAFGNWNKIYKYLKKKVFQKLDMLLYWNNTGLMGMHETASNLGTVFI